MEGNGQLKSEAKALIGKQWRKRGNQWNTTNILGSM